MLPHPQAVDLVIDAHPLALVAQRAAAFQQLENVVVAVERPDAEPQESAEEAVRDPGSRPSTPTTTCGRRGGSPGDVLLAGDDVDVRADRPPQLVDRLDRLEPVRHDKRQLGQPLPPG